MEETVWSGKGGDVEEGNGRGSGEQGYNRTSLHWRLVTNSSRKLLHIIIRILLVCHFLQITKSLFVCYFTVFY